MRMKENKIWCMREKYPLSFTTHNICEPPNLLYSTGLNKSPLCLSMTSRFWYRANNVSTPLPGKGPYKNLCQQVKQLELHMKFTLHIKHSKPKHHTENTKSRFHIKRCQMCDFRYLFLTNCLCLLGIFSVCTSGRLASASVWQLLVEVEFIFLSSTAPTSISHPRKRLRVIYHDTSCLHGR